MNFGLIIAVLAVCTSAARLGFHGSIYQYSNFGYLSPKEVAYMKKILKLKCLQKYGPRFCWFILEDFNNGLKHGHEHGLGQGHGIGHGQFQIWNAYFLKWHWNDELEFKLLCVAEF